MHADGFQHRIAFGVWLNDFRQTPITDETWPSIRIDESTIESFESVIALISSAGYTALDIFGLLTNRDWPLVVEDVINEKRKKQVDHLIRVAHDSGIRIIYGLGVYSWGFETIIKNDERVRGTNPQALCGSRAESQRWMEKVIDFVASTFDIDGFHLEAADQGRCSCAKCAEMGDVEYFSTLNKRTAEYIRGKWPGKILLVNTSGYLPWGDFICNDDVRHIIDVGTVIDIFIDGGNHGLFVHEHDRRRVVEQLPCSYGTSGGFWIYPPQHWERDRWFLPYFSRSANHLKQLYADGATSCELYLGPPSNPSAELCMYCNGLFTQNVRRSVDDIYSEAIEYLYQPEKDTANDALKHIFMEAEHAFFDNWVPERNRSLSEPFSDGIDGLFEFSSAYPERAIPGELFLEPLFCNAPGLPVYLTVHMKTAGRERYAQRLSDMRKTLAPIRNLCGRPEKIERLIACVDNVMNDIRMLQRIKELP